MRQTMAPRAKGGFTRRWRILLLIVFCAGLAFIRPALKGVPKEEKHSFLGSSLRGRDGFRVAENGKGDDKSSKVQWEDKVEGSQEEGRSISEVDTGQEKGVKMVTEKEETAVVVADPEPETAGWDWETMPVASDFHNPDTDLPTNPPEDLWDDPPDEGWRPCIKRPKNYPPATPLNETNGYIMVNLDGGLSQQMFEICDAVTLARIMNATLVVPKLEYDAFWKDASGFSEIFDLDYFRYRLRKEVNIVRVDEMPKELQSEDKWHMGNRQYLGQPEDYYREELAALKEHRVAWFRLGFYNPLAIYLPLQYEKLRCRAKYDALRFSEKVVGLGQKLVEKMKAMGNGRFVGMHLRFEEDMLAHSNCDFGGGEAEAAYFAQMRKDRKWPEVDRTPAQLRKDGQCPSEPREVAKWLRGLGFGPDTPLYLASGKIYRADYHMANFKTMFPRIQTKRSLLSAPELAELKGKSNFMAAVDLFVLTHADVATLTFHGQMRWQIAGERTWKGFKKTQMLPNWLMPCIEDKPWDEFQAEVRKWEMAGGPRNRSGEAYPVAIYGNPIPDCMCQKPGGPPLINAVKITEASGL